MNKNKSFVFYESFYNAIAKIPDKELQGQALMAIVEYGLFNTTPKEDTNFIVSMVVEQAKPQITASKNRHNACVKNGKSGGRPTTRIKEKNQTQNQSKNQTQNQRENQTQNQTQNQKKNLRGNLNVNVNDNYNINNNINERDKSLSGTLSLKQNENFIKTLKQKCPRVIINKTAEQIDLQNIDATLLFNAISKSEFLQGSTLEFLLAKYADIICDKYIDFNEPNKNNFEDGIYKHTPLTAEQETELWTSLDDIELTQDNKGAKV